MSGDTYCEKARHISATEAQIDILMTPVMESYADQVIAHNITYDETCLGKKP